MLWALGSGVPRCASAGHAGSGRLDASTGDPGCAGLFHFAHLHGLEGSYSIPLKCAHVLPAIAKHLSKSPAESDRARALACRSFGPFDAQRRHPRHMVEGPKPQNGTALSGPTFPRLPTVCRPTDVGMSGVEILAKSTSNSWSSGASSSPVGGSRWRWARPWTLVLIF